jgi:hypothetical protein
MGKSISVKTWEVSFLCWSDQPEVSFLVEADDKDQAVKYAKDLARSIDVTGIFATSVVEVK